MDVIYTERGGGWVAGSPWHLSVSGTWPFARIQVLEEQVIFTVGWVKFEIPYSEIKEVKRIFIVPFIADGVRIVHTKSDTPKWLVFWSLRNAKKVVELIQAQKGALKPTTPLKLLRLIIPQSDKLNSMILQLRFK